MIKRSLLLGLPLCLLVLAGCRGVRSEKPPIQLQLNMVQQERFNAQEANPLFADNRAMRMPVPGTVARSYGHDRITMGLGHVEPEEMAYYTGRTAAGAYETGFPLTVDRELLERGRRRYDIYCTPCHGMVGGGDGIIIGYGYVPAPTFHDERLRGVDNGYLYEVIQHGVRTMPAYGHQVSVNDRWAIVAYIRALQRSQHASPADVPPGEMSRIAN